METINSTVIALILKNNDTKSFEEFRPVSICNSLYKIIYKAIASRLEEVFSSTLLESDLGS